MKNVFIGPVAVVIGSLLLAACGEGTVVDTSGAGGSGGGGASGSGDGAGNASNDSTGAGASGAGSSGAGAGSAGTSGAGAGGAGSSGGSGDLCAPDNACNGIEHCSDQCFTDACCFLDCNCWPSDGRLHCSLYCD